MNTLIITGWGWKDYGCAAAIMLRKFPEAKVIGSSTNRLPEKLAEIADSPPDKLKNIIILGIGWRGEPEDIIASVKRLHKKNVNICWYSMLDLPEWLPEEFTKFVDCRIDPEDEYLTSWVAKNHQQDAADLVKLLDSEGKKNNRPDMAQKLLLIDAAMYFYRNYQDFDAYGTAIRTLAEGRNQFSEKQEKMIEHFERYGSRELIGRSPMIKNLRSLIEKVGPKDSARVLIWGETGTGKETVALQLHFKSPRKCEPFIVANCATLSPQLLISQLFGHKKGAFTGAVENHDGYFKQADGGTLFLDEIGELPPEAQAGLLRVLQDGRFNPLGNTEEIKVNVRIIAATNRNLAEMVRAGKFREDLFHRLNMVHIHISSLRERPDDISEIANAFWMNRHKRRLNTEQIAALESYDWPGNVRELHNVLELADILDENDFSMLIEENRRQWGLNDDASGASAEYPDDLTKMTQIHVKNVLEKYKGNISHAADALGIQRNTVKKYLVGNAGE